MRHIPASSIEAQAALLEMRAGVPGLAVSSFVVALFPAAVMLYLLLLFDVALPGHSAATLYGVTFIFLVILAFNGFISLLRRRMLGHIGDIAATHFTPRLDDVTARLGEGRVSRPGDGAQISRDLDAIQHFFRSSAAIAWLDMAGLPLLLLAQIFLGARFAVITLITAGALGFFLVKSLRAQEQPSRDLVTMLANRHAIAETSRSSIGTLRALGMRVRAMQAWRHANDRIAAIFVGLRERTRRDAVIAHGVRYAGFAALLLAGGLLAIDDRASGGVVISAAFLGWFALSPLVSAIETSDILIAGRQGWTRLDAALASIPSDGSALTLPEPAKTMNCESAALAVPGGKRPTVHGVNFALKAGEVMTVVGPGGCGKSVLLRGLSGAWPLVAGKVRLDGAALDQWDDELLGRHVGFMPQTIDLVEGTVAENIARFEPDANPEAVVGAAQTANVHEMIVRLPEGYNTQVGPGGNRLSQSQAQRIALARALYRDPFLIILDEPTAHLDGKAEKTVAAAVEAARARGAIVILGGVAASIVEMASHVLVMRDGTMVEFGEKEAVRKRIASRFSTGANAGREARARGAINTRAETDTAA